jgi:hypothetical protein
MGPLEVLLQGEGGMSSRSEFSPSEELPLRGADGPLLLEAWLNEVGGGTFAMAAKGRNCQAWFKPISRGFAGWQFSIIQLKSQQNLRLMPKNFPGLATRPAQR